MDNDFASGHVFTTGSYGDGSMLSLVGGPGIYDLQPGQHMTVRVRFKLGQRMDKTIRINVLMLAAS